jgi:hypothetical protein
MAKRSQGWVNWEDRLPYYRNSSCSLPLATRLHDHDSTTRDPGTAGQRHYPELGTRSHLVVV